MALATLGHLQIKMSTRRVKWINEQPNAYRYPAVRSFYILYINLFLTFLIFRKFEVASSLSDSMLRALIVLLLSSDMRNLVFESL